MPQRYAGFFDGNGGMRVAWARRLLMDQVDLMDQMDKTGASCDTPWVCLPQSGMARVKICRWGMQGNLMATAVCVLRGRGACV